MKGRESGMPDETYWESFFDAPEALVALFGGANVPGDVVEFGCGYGTFTIPAALRSDGIVTTFDIEPDLVDATSTRAEAAKLVNVRTCLRDFVAGGTGLPDSSQMMALMFNLLHIEEPIALLREALRVLRPEGRLAVIHWRSDIETPRGPSLDIRPTPAQCAQWMRAAGFANVASVELGSGSPYHFGLTASRP